MKIKSVQAYWVHIPITHDRQHTSDFGRTLSFDGTLVRIDTACGLTGWGEAKAQVGGMAQNQALTLMINEEFAPILVGEDPREEDGDEHRSYESEQSIRFHELLPRMLIRLDLYVLDGAQFRRTR